MYKLLFHNGSCVKNKYQSVVLPSQYNYEPPSAAFILEVSYFIMVPSLRKSIKVWYSKAQLRLEAAQGVGGLGGPCWLRGFSRLGA